MEEARWLSYHAGPQIRNLSLGSEFPISIEGKFCLCKLRTDYMYRGQQMLLPESAQYIFLTELGSGEFHIISILL